VEALTASDPRIGIALEARPSNSASTTSSVSACGPRSAANRRRLESEFLVAERIGETRDRGRDLRERAIEHRALYDQAQRPDQARRMPD
jgi:hypothetical protein